METQSLTPAAQVIIAIIPVVSIFLAAVLIFFVTLWRHHETKLRILKGTYTPQKFNAKAFTLLTGLCLAGIGLVLAVMFFLLEGLSWGMLSGLIPLAAGVAFLIFSCSCPADEK
ncbi:MAG: hypothetical protein II187_05200 [Treponema sp.]|jgi:hypothetical protein|nr:hypothetical protein [Treponema sp.]